MSNQALIKELEQLLADTYALYLKTQNYHWHVKGPHFSQLHELFQGQYEALAENIDEVAERIVMLGGQAPANFKALGALTNINDGDAGLTWQNMISDLASDQDKLINSAKNVLKAAQAVDDETTFGLIVEEIADYEKHKWFLENHIS